MALVVPVVEGHGEIRAVPRLLHRIAERYGRAVRVNNPIRVKAGSFINDTKYMRKYVALAAAKARSGGGLVIVILDCEDECAARLGPRLLAELRAAEPDVAAMVCLAVREYETWFLASAESLSGANGFPCEVQSPPEIERLRNAKGWLSEKLGGKYDPIVHQAAFTSVFDIEAAARRSASLERLVRHMGDWLSTVKA